MYVFSSTYNPWENIENDETNIFASLYSIPVSNVPILSALLWKSTVDDSLSTYIFYSDSKQGKIFLKVTGAVIKVICTELKTVQLVDEKGMMYRW